MRRLLLLAGVLGFLVACGGGDGGTEPEVVNGQIVYRIDGATCGNSAAAIELFVDGQSKGVQTLSTASPSAPITVQAGQHLVGARIANTTITWQTVTATVPPNGTYTHLLICQ